MEFMNEHTLKSLDIEYVFNMISPKTPYGIHEKNNVKPYTIGQEEILKKELNELQMLIDTISSNEREFLKISAILGDMKEIRGSLKRAKGGSVLDEVEFFVMKNFVFYVRDICNLQEDIKNLPQSFRLQRDVNIEKLLDPDGQGTRTFYIYDSYSENLKKIRDERRRLQREFDSAKRQIVETVENLVGGKLKLSGEISILKKDEDKLKRARECSYLTEGASTVLMATFKVKNDKNLDELSKKIEDLKLLEYDEEFGIRRGLTEKIVENLENLNKMVEGVGRLDYFLSKADFAISIGGKMPVLTDQPMISVKNGRHIRLEKTLRSKGKEFVPVSFTVSGGVTVITGANMGGKTVNLKVAGMLSAMTHYGLFVPAEEFKTCLFDYLYFSIGDMQSIDSGLSTFGSEISGMIDILKCSTYRGLILIDELARGTNPEEGYAISRAIVRYLKGRDAITMFTTHFDGITEEDDIEHLQVIGLKNIDFNDLFNKLKDEGAGIDAVLDYMDYRLEKVKGKHEVPKDAINIARLMGLDNNILNWAEDILKCRRED